MEKVMRLTLNQEVWALAANGYKIALNTETMSEMENRDLLKSKTVEVELLPIPNDWDCDTRGWAPSGYTSLGLSALIALGIEYPQLVEEGVKIMATSAVDDYSSVSFPFYACLQMEGETKMLAGDGSGFVPFCLRDIDKYKFKLLGIFVKK